MERVPMKTFFASPKRSSKDELNRQIQTITHNSLIDGVMHLIGGLVAVLNKNRQIVALNHSLLELLGVEQPQTVLGLRPGEALGCVYADEMEAGCGTSSYCLSCGAAIAIVSSQETKEPVESDCALVAECCGHRKDLFFHVIASPIELQNEQFILIFLYDNTHQQYQASLERTFFHDIKNTISGLLNAGELLALTVSKDNKEMARHIITMTERLSREVELQRYLSKAGPDGVGVRQELLSIDRIIDETYKTVAHHPANEDRKIRILNRAPKACVRTDLALIIRALSNMLINACEASDADCDVIFEAKRIKDEIVFSVWNHKAIPESIRNRIFQRNFSTKDGIGRGLGTFSMKLIAERLLGGRVYFQSSNGEGTRFYLCLACEPDAACTLNPKVA
jgi:K+-sensing histidine kinase KdpD